MHVIMDIDGTVGDCTHRRHLILNKPKRYDEFYALAKGDEPILPMVGVVNALFKAGHTILYCTGRPEKTRQDTVMWMGLVGLPVEYTMLYMRPDADFRPDNIVKAELYERMTKVDGFNPVLAFDDRPRIARLWKDLGLTVCRVNEADEF